MTETVFKKNMIMRLAVAVLVVTCFTFSCVSGTLAKYTWSSTSSASTAQTAKFAFSVNGTAITNATPTFFEVNLFSTRYLSAAGGNMGSNDAPDSAVTVWTSDTDKVIAPGTKGAFSVQISNTGEVSVEPSFTFTQTGTNLPIRYSIGQTSYSAGTPVVGNKIPMGETVTTTVNWEWLIDNDANASETTLGLAATSTITVIVACTVSQAN